MGEQYADTSWCVGLGLLGGWLLLRDRDSWRLLSVGTGWLLLVLAAIYTSGTSSHPSHLGSATMVAGCFALAGLAKLWPTIASPADSPAQWFQMGLSLAIVFTISTGLGFTRSPQWRISPDLSRYVAEIEHEFDGQPAAGVLLDEGDWIYLRKNVLMRDRQAILTTQLTPHYGLIDRIRGQEYAKILAHNVPDGGYAYDLGQDRGIGRELRAHYHEVRRIHRVRGMDDWNYYYQMMGDISVLEPIRPARVSTENTTEVPN